MHPLTHYLKQVRAIHGPGVAEKSYYGALETLFNAVGEPLDPQVICVMELQDTGAGMPDGGLFTAEQVQGDADLPQLPGARRHRGQGPRRRCARHRPERPGGALFAAIWPGVGHQSALLRVDRNG